MCDVEGIPPDSEPLERWQKARKAHKCCACDEIIEPGHIYHVTSGRWEGEFDTYKHCARCYKTWTILVQESQEPVPFMLNCGEVYEGDNEELLRLAFVTPHEGQAIAQLMKYEQDEQRKRWAKT